MLKALIMITKIRWEGADRTPVNEEPQILHLDNSEGEELALGDDLPDSKIKIKYIRDDHIVINVTNLITGSDENHAQNEHTLMLKKPFILHTPDPDNGFTLRVLVGKIFAPTPQTSSVPFNPTKPTQNPSPKPPPLRVAKNYFIQTQRSLKDIEEAIGTKCILYYVPMTRSIESDQADLFIEQLRTLGPQDKISVIVYGPGGDGMAVLRIANLLHSYCREVHIYIPLAASSAFTLLALAADSIYMSPSGYLGPIDAQYNVQTTFPNIPQTKDRFISGDSVNRIRDLIKKGSDGLLKDKPNSYLELFKYIHPTSIAHIDRSIGASERMARQLIKMRNNPPIDDAITVLIRKLIHDYPSHGFPIIASEARSLGLPVKDVPQSLTHMLWDLMKYYQAICRGTETILGAGHFHLEENSVVIEIHGKRLVKRLSLNRRFNPAIRQYETENNNSQWYSYTPATKPGVPFNFTPIEAGEYLTTSS